MRKSLQWADLVRPTCMYFVLLDSCSLIAPFIPSSASLTTSSRQDTIEEGVLVEPRQYSQRGTLGAIISLSRLGAVLVGAGGWGTHQLRPWHLIGFRQSESFG